MALSLIHIFKTAVVETVKAATETVKAATESVKETAKEAVKETAKAPAKTAGKAEAKKPAVRRTAKKAAVAAEEIFIQYAGKEFTTKDVVANVKKAWTEMTGKKEEDIQDIKVYVKTEENKAYYLSLIHISICTPHFAVYFARIRLP